MSTGIYKNMTAIKRKTILESKPRTPPHMHQYAMLILEGVPPLEAADQLGRPGKSLEYLEHPNFIDAMLFVTARKLTGDMLPKALHTLTKLLSDADSRVQLGAAKTIVAIATPSQGVVHGYSDTTSGDLESLSAQDLAEMIARLEDMKAGKAKDISAQSDTANDTNPLFQFG
jgi:hypothetical protein